MSPVEQLATTIAGRCTALAPFIGQIDDSAAVAMCTAVVAELAGDDPHVGAEAAQSVLAVCWPDSQPEDCGHADWWTTPLGRLVARHTPGHTSVTHAVAADMLGVPRNSIGALKARGHLDRADDGGVTRASVLARIAR